MRLTPALCHRLLLVSLVLVAGGARAEDHADGSQFETLPIPIDTLSPGKVEVVEVFSYGCVHCYTFDPALENWRHSQPTDVVFRRVPAIFNDQFLYLAQVYYGAEALGVEDKVHVPLFEAIHVKQVDLRDPNVLAGIFRESAGVSGEELVKMVNSMGVLTRVKQADGFGRVSGVHGVPSLVVNGKYLVDGKMAGDNTRMLQVVDYLIQREREGAAGALIQREREGAAGALIQREREGAAGALIQREREGAGAASPTPASATQPPSAPTGTTAAPQ